MDQPCSHLSWQPKAQTYRLGHFFNRINIASGILNDLNISLRGPQNNAMLRGPQNNAVIFLSGEIKMLFSIKGLEQPHHLRTFIYRLREAGWLCPRYLSSRVSVFSSRKWESKNFATKEEKVEGRGEQREGCLPSDKVVMCIKCYNNLQKIWFTIHAQKPSPLPIQTCMY